MQNWTKKNFVKFGQNHFKDIQKFLNMIESINEFKRYI